MSKTFKIALASMFVAAAFVATSASASAPASSFPRNLAMGATGSDVKELQMFLNACPDTKLAVAAGATGSMGNESMTYGPATMTAVMAYQTKVGVSAVGAFGPQTRAQAAAVGNVCGTTTTTTTTTTPTEALCPNGMTLASNCTAAPATTGTTTTTTTTTTPAGMSGEGSPEDIDVNDADDTDLKEGQEGAELGSIEFTAEDGSLQINRVDVVFEAGGSNDEEDPWNVFDSVALEVDGKEVASMDTDSKSDWTETTTNDVYRLRFSGLNWVVGEDKDVELMVVADISDSVEGANNGEAWSISFESNLNGADGLRYQDASGFVDSFGDINTADFNIEEPGGDSEFEVSEASSSPKSATLEVKETSTTTHTVAVFKVEADEDGGDIKLTDFPVTVAVTNPAGSLATYNYNAVVDDVILEIDGKTYTADGSMPSTAIGNGATITPTFTFEDLEDDNVVVEAGDTMNATLKVKFKSQGVAAANYDNSTTVIASAAGSSSDVEDADSGDAIGSVDFTATADTMTLAGTGISIAIDSKDADLQTVDLADNDLGVYEIKVKVTAFGDDMYISQSGATAYTAQIENASSGAVLTPTTVSTTVSSTADTEGSAYRIEKGETETFTFTITANPATGDEGLSIRAQLLTVVAGLTSGAPTGYTYTVPADSMTTFETNGVVIPD